MIGKDIWRIRLNRGGAAPPLHARLRAWAVAAVAFLGLCTAARADLLFRSVQPADGAEPSSELRNYANPNDTAYPRKRADGGEIGSEQVQVFLRGAITQDDVYGAKVMQSLVKRGRQKIAGNVVIFAGDGGDVDAAIELGRTLRKLGVSTLVPRGEQCLSSCVFAFMGGDKRMIAGRLGIHRPYFASARKVIDRRAYYRQLQKRLRDYIEELDFPSALYEAVMAVPPESISILSASDLKRFYLQGMSPAAEDEMDAAAARHLGISVTEYLQRKAKGEGCAVALGGAAGCAAPVPNVAAKDSSADDSAPRAFDQRMPPSSAQQGDAQGPGTSRGAAGSSWIAY